MAFLIPNKTNIWYIRPSIDLRQALWDRDGKATTQQICGQGRGQSHAWAVL